MKIGDRVEVTSPWFAGKRGTVVAMWLLMVSVDLDGDKPRPFWDWELAPEVAAPPVRLVYVDGRRIA